MAQVIFISKKTVRDAWLSAVAHVLYTGDDIRTEYDKEEDPPSKDATVLIEIEKPMSEPISRKDKVMKINSKYGNSFEVYGCMADTYLIGSIQSGYIEEIMEGANDHYLWDSDTSFPYSITIEFLTIHLIPWRILLMLTMTWNSSIIIS